MHFIPTEVSVVTSTERRMRLRIAVINAIFPAKTFDLLRILKGTVSATTSVLYRVTAKPKETNAVPDSMAVYMASSVI